jgi:hypothetical protein
MTLLGSVHRNVLEDKLYEYMARPPSPADDPALLAAADAGKRTWEDGSEVRGGPFVTPLQITIR